MKSDKQKLKKLEETYAEELKRRDKIIDGLKEQNNVIMKSALNQSKKIDDLTKRLDEVIKRKK